MRFLGRPLCAAAIAALFCTTASARAADVGVNAGVLEVVAVPGADHVGLYPYVAGSLAIPFESVTLVPSLGVEWSPDLERWGAVVNLTADYVIVDGLGLDLNLTLIHDQAGGEFSKADFYLGAGPGVSIFLGRWTLSPSVVVFRGLNVPGWTTSFGLNLGFTL